MKHTFTSCDLYENKDYFTHYQLLNESAVDYLSTPSNKVMSVLSDWFSRLGYNAQVQCNHEHWMYAPSASPIGKDLLDAYEQCFSIIEDRIQFGEAESSPSNSQRTAALLVLGNLLLAAFPAPSPMFLSNGTIGGFWRRGKCYASIDFEEDGEHTWAITNGKEVEVGSWHQDDMPLPSDLLANIQKVLISFV
ncbi:MAG: hypothetical protein PHV02_08215 [Rhodocyclaceae bacterium]|nr:hypothetical protein [Rhodocyclaceae bacterium]